MSNKPRIYREHTKLRLQYLALRRAETVAYNTDKEAYRKHFRGSTLRLPRHNQPPRKRLAALRDAADALYAFQQAHKEKFDE